MKHFYVKFGDRLLSHRVEKQTKIQMAAKTLPPQATTAVGTGNNVLPSNYKIPQRTCIQVPRPLTLQHFCDSFVPRPVLAQNLWG